MEKGEQGMAIQVNMRTYRPQPVSSKTGRRAAPRFSITLSGEQWRCLAILVAIALVAGLVITHFFHGKLVDMRARAEQLRVVNTAIGNENVRLLATRAQLSSKTYIVSRVGTKLNLFEPEKGQLHRM
jgi:hypothetical protein